MNIVVLSGRLGASVRFVEVSEKSSVAQFSIAENISYKGSDGEKKVKTLWHKIEAWNKLASVCNEKLKKGMKVTIQGNLSYNEYTNKKDQEVKESVIKLEKITFLPELSYKTDEQIYTADQIPF